MSNGNCVSIVFCPDNNGEAIKFQELVKTQYPELDFEILPVTSNTTPHPQGAVVALLFDRTFGDSDGRTEWLAQLNNSRATTPLLPVALDTSCGKPPDPVSGLKSRFLETDADEIILSVGALMGLALRPGQNKVFVSYRAADGKVAAIKLHEFLTSCGYASWLDEGRDAYDDPNLELGDDVQTKIEESLSGANALILIDTPKVVESKWVRLEVELAVGKMIPIYPIVLHPNTDTTSAARFSVLRPLHRRICIESEFEGEQLIFSDSELPKIVSNVEEYLLTVYRNRVLQPRELEKWFKEKQWEFGRSKEKGYLHDGRIGEVPNFFTLLACCSFENTIFSPRLRSYVDDIRELAAGGKSYTRNIFLYPGATLNNEDVKDIMTNEVPALVDQNALLLSYNEAVARIGTMAGGYYE